MSEHYSEDVYNEDIDTSSYDDTTSYDDPSGSEQLWDTPSEGLDGIEQDIQDLDDSINVPVDYTDVPDVPDVPDYAEDGTPIETVDGTSPDPWVQDQIDAANGEPPAPDTLDADVNTGAEPWTDENGNVLDPETGLPYVDPLDVPQGGDMPQTDPNDPTAGDPYGDDPYNYDGPSGMEELPDGHYLDPTTGVEYDENGNAVDGTDYNDGADDPIDYSDYDPDAYTPDVYDYQEPPVWDEANDPYNDPAYNPYVEVYGDQYDVVYDPCYGDHDYNSQSIYYVDQSTNIDVHQDIYASDTTYISDNDTYAPVDVNDVDVSVYDTWDGYDESYDAPYTSYDALEVAHFTPDYDVTDFAGAGTPLSDGAFFHGVEDPSHGPVSVEASIVEKITGEPYNELSAVQEAENAGIFDPETGMYNTQVGSYLELHGIETETVYGADFNQVLDALENGDQVIAVVDTNETVDPLRDVATGEPIEQNPPALNSVWITGIDVDDNGNAYVIVNDPTSPDGQTQAIAIEDFANAWADGDNQAVIAHTGVPNGS